MTQNLILVIYHSNCADGFGSAYAFWKWLGNKADYYPGKYQEPPPDVKGKTVYIVDFSYKKAIIEEMLNDAKSITIIDHHASAIEDLKDLKHPSLYKYFENNHSGAYLSWKYCFSKEPPALIKHIQDRDLWKFELPNTKEISAALFSREWTFEDWDKIVSEGLDSLILEGKALERQRKKDLDTLLKIGTRMMNIGGYEVPVAAMPPMFTSEAGHVMAQDHPFAACYYDSPHYRNFSLRSEANGLDVSKIAVKYGGGGHPRAAGFKVPRDHDLAKS